MTDSAQVDVGMIPGIPQRESSLLLKKLQQEPAVQRVLLYGSRALGRHRSGSDIDLCLEAPAMGLQELLELGARLDDLMLPWPIDLQLRHLIDHADLQAHLERAGEVLWERCERQDDVQQAE
ncbi:MAG: nucleotidyltransferase domain-containing protein [Prochlorococcus sp.]|nr:nucleotidyltransferase domain-containing protein [Prochlorococcaceae cyanobacterium Fu_MAG_50]